MTGYQNRQRDGMSSLIDLARKLCGIKTAFGPIIAAKYPPNSPIGLLSAACDGVCALLPEAADQFYAPEGDNSDVSENPESAAGINPDAPAAPPTPDYD